MKTAVDLKESSKSDLRLILLSLDNLVKDKTFSKSKSGSVLNTLKYLRDTMSSLSYNLHNDKVSLKVAMEDFEFYNPDFDKYEIEHLDLLPYSLYDELDEVPLDLFYDVRRLTFNIKSLFSNIYPEC